MKSVDRQSDPIRPAMNQGGAATLALTLLLLFCMSLIMLYSARVGVTEQRLAVNDAHARAAFAASQAGLAAILHHLAVPHRVPASFDSNGWFEIAPLAGTLGNGAGFGASAHNRGLTPFQSDVLRIVAQGQSEDGSSRRMTSQLAVFTSLLPNIPPAPLVIRGNLTPGNGLWLANPADSVAAWVGGLHLPGGIIETRLAAGARCLPQGICAEDARLAALSDGLFFENFFGRPPSALRSIALDIRCAACSPGTPDVSGPDVIWLHNDGGTVTLDTAQIGTEDRPVVAIIDGDMKITGTVQLYGLLYISGNWRAGTGTVSANGAVIVAGEALDIGAAQLDYHPVILDTLHAEGRYTVIPGSWTDF